MRVLVVDDEIKNAELTALELRDAGHEVEFVNGSAWHCGSSSRGRTTPSSPTCGWRRLTVSPC